ncbi:MAG TPA: hypothetical protein VIL36_11170 [Acidimicrobiales bacterium]
MLRRRRPPDDPLAHVDPAAAPPRFARTVADAVEARRRYRAMVAGLRPGPVRDRLEATGERVDAGVAAVWDAVTRAGEVERLLAALDPERVTDEYKRAKRSGQDPELEAALAQRFASVQRLLNALDDTEERLRLLEARLTAAVARAAEVALGGGTGAETVSAELDGVVDELTTLRAALDEVDRA